MLTASDVIERLQLAPHIEGGFFHRTYTSRESVTLANGDVRPAMTSIYYLITKSSPISYFARNRSDILHFHLHGAALRYHLVRGDGIYQSFGLGHDTDAGQPPTLLVSGGTWKACELESGEFALISEVVCPGFDYADMQLAEVADLVDCASLPNGWQRWIKPPTSPMDR